MVAMFGTAKQGDRNFYYNADFTLRCPFERPFHDLLVVIES